MVTGKKKSILLVFGELDVDKGVEMEPINIQVEMDQVNWTG